VIEKHFSPRELAELYGIRESTLAQWRFRSKKEPSAPARGPRFVKVGRLVRYPESGVKAWDCQRELVSTPTTK
jgi:predicted DNA-binding transcriptional regulator AlpA